MKKRKLTPFGVWVKTTAVEKDIKLYELADLVGVPRQNITRILYGDVKESKHNSTIIEILARDENEKIEALQKI